MGDRPHTTTAPGIDRRSPSSRFSLNFENYGFGVEWAIAQSLYIPKPHLLQRHSQKFCW
ncbi:hypothetical protein [Vacuolonema iberomarrocanum]|uniref:hypothetical protein n=1 Tax=Vacuolonema iberomarrocanum TaxID=3454632 RepID=UPI001A05DCC5|nr:hypothetical protein [filamentous cyanobacterium LEGE 07170]